MHVAGHALPSHGFVAPPCPPCRMIRRQMVSSSLRGNTDTFADRASVDPIHTQNSRHSEAILLMDNATAQFTLYAVTIVGVLVWLAALICFNKASQIHLRLAETADTRFDFGETVKRERVFGTAEVDGIPSELSARAANLLARHGLREVGAVKITRQTDDHVAFEGCGPSPAGRQSKSLLDRGQLQFTREAPGRTRIDYAVDLTGGRGLLIIGSALLGVGALALVAGFVLMSVLVVPNAQPGVRAQAVQMLQVSHLLWPPFLVAFLYRRRYTVVQAQLDALVNNLPFCEV